MAKNCDVKATTISSLVLKVISQVVRVLALKYQRRKSLNVVSPLIKKRYQISVKKSIDVSESFLQNQKIRNLEITNSNDCIVIV